ncbi:hypothetical protein HUJ04_005196 [Dendroctonus ponderosae]|uniref:MD-2-related lipid-recognition domain-containing protein n=1 Tax=Dendroctonus ponderosae TaxID=77166 RepID=A0AAR5Q7U8_DENPD|nr:hypothetical protein HUJ04_005196 [Dendroctonus ponderosae]
MLRLIHEYAKLAEERSVCEDKLNITGFDFHKYNRTTKALSVNFTVLEDVTIDNDLEIKTTLYLWKNNDYKKTPFMWSMQTCKVLDNNNFGIQLLMKDSTTQKCPLLKGKHYIRNVSPPDLQGWPSVIPEGKWKLNIEYYKQKQYCFTVEWFAIISKN